VQCCLTHEWAFTLPVSHTNNFDSKILGLLDFFGRVPKIQQMTPFLFNQQRKTHKCPTRLCLPSITAIPILTHHFGAAQPWWTMQKAHVQQEVHDINTCPAGCPCVLCFVGGLKKQWPQPTRIDYRSTSQIGHVRLRFVLVFLGLNWTFS